MIKILGIGTGKFEKLTLEGYELISNSKNIVLQTAKIPFAEEMKRRNIRFTSLDHFYDEAEDFDDLMEKVSDYLAGMKEDVLFCVLGSIHTSEFVRALSGCELEIVSGLGPAEEVIDMAVLSSGSDNYHFLTASSIEDLMYDGRSDLVITEIDSLYSAYGVIEKLQRYFSPGKEVILMHDDAVNKMTLEGLYDFSKWDYSCSLYVPGDILSERDGYTVEDLLYIMDRLLGKNGCEWDRAQDHESLRQYLLEETYEVIEAINKKDDAMLCDELGDVLYQLVFHSKLSEKHSSFDFLDVSTAICEKMIKRHPHVFRDPSMREDWEEIKKKEKKQISTLESLMDIPAGMGALLKHQKIVRKLDHLESRRKATEDILGDLRKKADEIERSGADEDRLGSLLSLVTELAYANDINAEMALEKETEKMIEQYR